FSNCADAVIAWQTKAPISCIGFALERQTRDDPRIEVVSVPGGKSSYEVPIQDYFWIDTGVRAGGEYCYRAVPVLREKQGLAEALKGDPSAWTGWIRIATGTTTGISCYFNRGLATALSSFPSELPRTLRSEDMKMPGSELRNFLGGELRTALIR